MKKLTFLFLTLCACVEPNDSSCRKSFDCPSDTFCMAGTCTAMPAPEEAKTGGLEAEQTPPKRNTLPEFEPEPEVEPIEPGPDGEPEPDEIVEPEPTYDPEHPCLAPYQPEPGALIISEVLSDPPNGLDGDANSDGERDAYSDEFVELENLTPFALALDDVHLYVGERHKFHFQEFCLKPYEKVVVFSSGTTNLPPEISVFTTETRLGLPNAGGYVDIMIRDLLVDTFVFPENSYGSWVPAEGSVQSHFDAHQSWFSPGY